MNQEEKPNNPYSIQNWEKLTPRTHEPIGKWLRTPKNEEYLEDGYLYAICDGGKVFKPELSGNSLFVTELRPDGTRQRVRWHTSWRIEVQK